MNFAKFLRAAFFIEHLRWLLLEVWGFWNNNLIWYLLRFEKARDKICSELFLADPLYFFTYSLVFFLIHTYH